MAALPPSRCGCGGGIRTHRPAVYETAELPPALLRRNTSECRSRRKKRILLLIQGEHREVKSVLPRGFARPSQRSVSLKPVNERL